MLTAIGRLTLVLGFMAFITVLCLSVSYNSRNLRANVKDYIMHHRN